MVSPNSFEELMRSAIAEAAESGEDVPVGALIVSPTGEVIAVAHNEREAEHDPTAHAEIVAIRRAAKLRSDWRLEDCTLVVTLEPCVMCAGAIVAARIGRVVFGAWDARVGASGSLYDLIRDARLGAPAEVISGVLEQECSSQLRAFFESKRA
jgi:tRNA(adenine34) deaminase